MKQKISENKTLLVLGIFLAFLIRENFSFPAIIRWLLFAIQLFLLVVLIYGKISNTSEK